MVNITYENNSIIFENNGLKRIVPLNSISYEISDVNQDVIVRFLIDQTLYRVESIDNMLINGVPADKNTVTDQLNFMFMMSSGTGGTGGDTITSVTTTTLLNGNTQLAVRTDQKPMGHITELPIPLIPILPEDIKEGRAVLSKNSEGSFVWVDSTINSELTIFVDVNNTDDISIQDGTLNSPYSSLQKGIDNLVLGASIRVADGVYPEDIVINNISNTTINAFGVKGQYRVIINSLTISGNSQRIGLQNIQCNGDYNYTSTGSLIYIDNLAVRGVVNLNSGGYHRYDDCFFFNTNVLGSTFADFRNCQCEDNSTWTVNSATATLSVIGGLNAKYVHTNGTLALSNGTNVLPVGDNIGILSTSNNGLLFLGDGISLMQGNGQYAGINKTGSCNCIFGLFPYNTANTTLNGTISYSKLQSNQIEIPLESTLMPLSSSNGAIGISTNVSRSDHAHPWDLVISPTNQTTGNFRSSSVVSDITYFGSFNDLGIFKLQNGIISQTNQTTGNFLTSCVVGNVAYFGSFSDLGIFKLQNGVVSLTNQTTGNFYTSCVVGDIVYFGSNSNLGIYKIENGIVSPTNQTTGNFLTSCVVGNVAYFGSGSSLGIHKIENGVVSPTNQTTGNFLTSCVVENTAYFGSYNSNLGIRKIENGVVSPTNQTTGNFYTSCVVGNVAYFGSGNNTGIFKLQNGIIYQTNKVTDTFITSCVVGNIAYFGSYNSNLGIHKIENGVVSPTNQTTGNFLTSCVVGNTGYFGSNSNLGIISLSNSDYAINSLNTRLINRITTIEATSPQNSTFTANIVGTTTAGTATYSRRIASATQTGVDINVRIELAGTITGATGNLNITGLPTGNLTSSTLISPIQYVGYSSSPMIVKLINATTLQLYAQRTNSAATPAVIGTDLSSTNFELSINFTYKK